MQEATGGGLPQPAWNFPDLTSAAHITASRVVSRRPFDPIMDRSPPDRWIHRTELLILTIGIGLRVARFAQPRPLWLDEALIALNLFTRRPLDFFRPLDHNQISPPGFLLGEWLVTALAGSGEKALRFLPLVAAIAALILFARLARRILDPAMALLATALAALSPLLIFYAAEVKSYGFDWLAAILVMHATLTVIERPSRQAWVQWALAAMFSAFVSTPAPFVVGGCALALLAAPGVRRSPRPLLHLLAAGTPAALIAGFHLLMNARDSATTSFMQLYWTQTFLEPNLSGVLRAARLARDFLASTLFGDLTVESLPRKTMSIVVATAGVGAFALGRRSLPAAVMLLAPVLLAAVASLGRLWPLEPRLLLFAVPAAVITVAAGVGALAHLGPRRARTAVLGTLSAAIIAAAVMGVPREIRPQSRFLGVPDALREASPRLGPSAIVYLSSDIAPAATYYLRFHPDRLELGGDALSPDSTLRGRRMIPASWPKFINAGPGLPPVTSRILDTEWLEREGRRISEPQATEIWVLIGNRDLRVALPSWLEAAGATREAEYETKGVRVLKYRRN